MFDDEARPLTRRGFLAAGAAASGGLLLAACGSSSSTPTSTAPVAAAKPTVKPTPDGDITWFTFAEYVPPKVVKDFEKEYGVKVKQSFMNTAPEYVQKLASGAPFDVITTTSSLMEQTTGGKLVQSFDPGDLKNWGEVLPYFANPWWEANGQYRFTIPYGYGPTGVMYRKDKINGSLAHTWNDMWSHPEAKGHIFLLSQQGDTMGMALSKNGFDSNSAARDQVVKAADSLLQLKPSVASFTTDLAPPVQSGDAWLMEGWTTPIFIGLQQAKSADNIDFYVPTQAPLLACDTLSIGAHAKAPGTALLFMDWMLKPENNGALGAFCLQNTGSKAGNAAFDEAIKKYPMFQFDSGLLDDKKNWKRNPIGARAQLWNQQWARVNA